MNLADLILPLTTTRNLMGFLVSKGLKCALALTTELPVIYRIANALQTPCVLFIADIRSDQVTPVLPSSFSEYFLCGNNLVCGDSTGRLRICVVAEKTTRGCCRCSVVFRNPRARHWTCSTGLSGPCRSLHLFSTYRTIHDARSDPAATATDCCP